MSLNEKFLSSVFKKEKNFDSYIAEWMWRNPLNQSALKLENYLYQKNYNLNNLHSHSFCVVSLAVRPKNYDEFFSSLKRQNYSKYSVVMGYINPENEFDIKKY